MPPPYQGDERDRSPHPYARHSRHPEKSSTDEHTSPALSSESGTEADDEGPQQFLKALPPPVLRPTKGLKRDPTQEGIVTPLLTPSQLDREGRRLSQGYFEPFSLDRKPVSPQLPQPEQQKQPEEDELQAARRVFEKRRRAERIRRISEGALLAVIGVFVISGPFVWESLWKWHRGKFGKSRKELLEAQDLHFTAELFSQIAAVVLLIAAYPLRIVVFAPSENKVWKRFRVPASFDPASVLYPTFVPVLVALALLPQYPAVLLPNLILGLASLPPRLFPPASRLKDINVLHWMVSIIPLVFSTDTEFPSSTFPSSYTKMTAGKEFINHPVLSPELLVLLYPLHQALLPPLHYLTTSSLLPAEKHLLSASLINILFFAASPQTSILQSLLWIGGVWLLVCCTHVLSWNVALARVPRWRFRRISSKSGRRLDRKGEGLFLTLKRMIYPFHTDRSDESDADEDAPVQSSKSPKRPKLDVSNIIDMADIHEPRSAADASPKLPSLPIIKLADSRRRRHTIASMDAPNSILGAINPARRRPRNWYLDLTPEAASIHKWTYATYIYAVIAFVILIPVRSSISTYALEGKEPVIWAFNYLFSDAINLYSVFNGEGHEEWLEMLYLHRFSISGLRMLLGASIFRLLLVAYWLVVLPIGLLAVISLSAHIEVDTRRKVFHAIMVTMLLPSIFIDPCFCSFALCLVLAIFLLLEVIRAGQVPPLGLAIGRFVAPYVDGRDLRGPMVVSHVFLLIGCAIPLWLSLAGIDRRLSGHDGWETENETREVAMVAGVVCVGMGDAAASLIGRRFGRRKWPWIGGKSLEGSAAFAIAVTIGLMAAKLWIRIGGWRESEGLGGGWSEVGRWKTVAFASEEAEDWYAGWAVIEGPTRGWSFWTVEVTKAWVCGCGASFMEAVLTGANDNVVVPVALWLLVKSLNV